MLEVITDLVICLQIKPEKEEKIIYLNELV